MNSFSFHLGFIRIWMRGKIVVDTSMVRTTLPNTLFWFIPKGSHQETIPLKNISSVQNSFSISGAQLLIGACLSYLAGSDLIRGRHSLGVMIVALLGVIFICNAFRVILVIEKSGLAFAIRLPFYEKKTAKRIADAITAQLYKDTDKTDLGLYFDRKDK